jgi:cyclohexa-1,5-dienecarbonyl-CoA hydratase
MATKAIREPNAADFERRFNHAERVYLEELLPSHDGVEGIRAFIDKRPPAWKNV